MTELLYLEADSDLCMGLDTLATTLGLLPESHSVQSRRRTMVDELNYVRFTISPVHSMLLEMGISGGAFQSLSRHYGKIFQSSERGLKAAGISPAFVPLPLDTEGPEEVKRSEVQGDGDA